MTQTVQIKLSDSPSLLTGRILDEAEYPRWARSGEIIIRVGARDYPAKWSEQRQAYIAI